MSLPRDDGSDEDRIDPAEIDQVIEARARAVTLLEELLRRQVEIDAAPPDLPPEKLALGRMAMEKAIAAARRTVEALDGALEVAGVKLQ